MKINENKEIFMEVRFGDLEPGDTFVIERGFGYAYAIKTRTTLVEDIAFNLKDGSVMWLKPDVLVTPVEIIGDVKWPDKVIKRK